MKNGNILTFGGDQAERALDLDIDFTQTLLSFDKNSLIG